MPDESPGSGGLHGQPGPGSNIPPVDKSRGEVMKLSELNGQHVGHVVRLATWTEVGTPSFTVQGLLSRVDHHADLISDRALMDARETFVLGRVWTSLTINGVDQGDFTDDDTSSVEVIR